MQGISARTRLFMLVSLVLVGLPGMAAQPTAAAVVFTVTAASDGDDGSCTASHCTLREAIAAANAAPGADVIEFALGGGVPTIAVGGSGLGPLPPATGAVTVDGATGGAARVELDGSAAGAGAAGLTLAGGGSTVRNLVVNRFDGHGILVTGGGGNRVEANLIGTDAAGAADLGNGGAGVWVDDQGANTVGPGNVISANRNGVVIAGDETATGNVVTGNLIGTDAAGTADLGNGAFGVVVTGAVANVVGPANVISANDEGGVRVIDGGYATRTADNVVRGNRIGTDAAGGAPLGNGRDGVLVEFAARFLVEDNVISANADDGVQVSSFTQAGFTGDGRVRGNRIGTDAAGAAGLGNGGHGVRLARATNTLLDGNLISANAGDGIRVDDPFGETPAPLGNRVEANLIGTDAAGAADLGNSVGVRVVGQSGNDVGPGNLISANLIGVLLEAGAGANAVKGNRIGTDASGAGPLPNEADGIAILDASGNTIGGTAAGEGNVIAYNGPGFIGGSGVVVTEVFSTATGNAIRGNSIRDNNRLGIDLGDDLVTAGDAGDADTGPNGLQNFPVVTSAESNGATTTVTGTLASTPATAFALDFFASAACDGSGHGEGGTYLGSATVTTDGAGQASFTTDLPAIAAGSLVTATATGPAGDTSEFSPCTAAGAAPPGSLRFGAAAYTVAEGAGTATVTVVRTGGAGGSVTVDVTSGDGSATAGADYTAVSTTLTFAPGQTAASFTVAVAADALEEGDETLLLSLRAPTGGASLGSPATAVLTIVDDDAPTGCTITGTPGDDVLTGTGRDDVICGLGGNDTLAGGGGDDVLLGGPGDDVLDGGRDDDVLDGGISDDTLRGGAGDDRLTGGPGTDQLSGDAGNDVLDGTDQVAGNDRLDGGTGVDGCTGDSGDPRKGCP